LDELKDFPEFVAYTIIALKKLKADVPEEFKKDCRFAKIYDGKRIKIVKICNLL